MIIGSKSVPVFNPNSELMQLKELVMSSVAENILT